MSDDEKNQTEFNVDVSDPSSEVPRARYRIGCQNYFEEVRALRPATVHDNGDYQILADPYRLRTPEYTLRDNLSLVCDRYTVIRISRLSWVGPIVSIHEDVETNNNYSGTYVRRRYQTLDLRTGESASLDALIDRTSIIEAIKNDSWVQRWIEGMKERIAEEETDEEKREETVVLLDKFRRSTELAELEELLVEIVSGEARYPVRIGFQGYALYIYDATRNRVAMRLSLGSMELGRLERPTILGLWVEPRPEFRELFRQAHEEGMLMEEGELEFEGSWGEREEWLDY